MKMLNYTSRSSNYRTKKTPQSHDLQKLLHHFNVPSGETIVSRTILHVPFLSTWILSLWNKPFLPKAWVAFKLFVFIWQKNAEIPLKVSVITLAIIFCTVILRTGENLRRVLLPVKSLFFLCVPPFLLDCTAGCQDFWRQERVFHSHGLIKTVIIQLYSFFHAKPLAVQLRSILYYTNHDDLSTLAV